MEAIHALETANREFESRLREVGPDDWTKATPCPDWDVRGLVNHVLLGTRMSVQLLAGMPRDEVIAGLDDDLFSEAEDPVVAFTDLAAEMLAGFSAPGGLEGVVDHPAGQFPRSMFLGFRVCDGAVHAWDLATAIGADTALDSEVVQYLWDDAQPQRDMLAASGMFGDGSSGSIGVDASLQTQYLDLMGRRP